MVNNVLAPVAWGAMWFSIIVILCLVAVLVSFFVSKRGGGSGFGGFGKGGNLDGFAHGTLTLTGVSERPSDGDKNNEMFCTIAGTILGDQTAPTEVYGHLVVKTGDPWPAIGHDVPVVYKPGKTESTWRIAQEPHPNAGDQGPNENR